MESDLHYSDGQVKVFDSPYTSVDKATKKIVSHLFEVTEDLTLVVVPIHKQTGENDCGIWLQFPLQLPWYLGLAKMAFSRIR